MAIKSIIYIFHFVRFHKMLILLKIIVQNTSSEMYFNPQLSCSFHLTLHENFAKYTLNYINMHRRVSYNLNIWFVESEGHSVRRTAPEAKALQSSRRGHLSGMLGVCICFLYRYAACCVCFLYRYAERYVCFLGMLHVTFVSAVCWTICMFPYGAIPYLPSYFLWKFNIIISNSDGFAC